MLSAIPPLQDDEEDVPYDVESLFTNIPIEKAINHIIEQIYVHKKLVPVRLKLIFGECTFKFSNWFLKQVYGCTMGGPLSVTFSHIYMVKMENDVLILSKPIFYCTFVSNIFSRWKLEDNVLFDWLNNYHPNIKLAMEVNKFLDTKLTNINGAYKFNVSGKTQNYFHHGPPELQNAMNEIQSMVIFIDQNEYQTLAKKFPW